MIVVGVDGSAGSKEALRWAIATARRHVTSITAVYVWQRPSATGWGYIPPELLETEELQRRARERLEEAVAEARGLHDDVDVACVAREGVAADVLIDEAAAAEMLVVGSRGYGGFASLLLGSTGSACAHHAPCPVVIVRPVVVSHHERVHEAVAV